MKEIFKIAPFIFTEIWRTSSSLVSVDATDNVYTEVNKEIYNDINDNIHLMTDEMKFLLI